jgi:hypothetical protein
LYILRILVNIYLVATASCSAKIMISEGIPIDLVTDKYGAKLIYLPAREQSGFTDHLWHFFFFDTFY